MHIFLETDRLILRRFTEDDVDNLVDLDSDPAVVWDGRSTPREEVERDHIPAYLDYYQRYQGYGFWAAIEKSSGRFLGWFHFRPNVPDGDGPLEPELGYRLHRDAWGRGFASEGSRALIDMGFERLGVERVHASTMAVNVGSRRVMEKAGMRFVREFHADWPVRIPGDEHGDVEYAIERAQWESDRAPEIRA